MTNPVCSTPGSRRLARLTWASLPAAALLATPLAHAADAAPAAKAETAEIVVTAQKRTENVQKVPIAVTVVGADQLDRRGVQGIGDLSQASASLEFTAPSAAPGGGGFVRGIGTNQLGGATVSSSVSVVLDGVVLGNANISDLFDTERVEVLKGPQGTLFGSSVSAGVLNVTSRAPKIGVTEGFVNGELALSDLGSEYTRKVLRGAINLPVSDNSALRIAVQTYGEDGMTTDAFTGQRETLSAYAIRLRYKATFGDNVTFNLTGDYDRILDDNQSILTYRAALAGSPLAQALAACGVTPSATNTQSCQNSPTFSHIGIGGVSAQFDIALGDKTLTSISSWRERQNFSANNIIGIDPATAGQYFTNCIVEPQFKCNPIRNLFSGTGTNPIDNRNNLVTQEIRLTSAANHHLEWVAGLYAQHTTYLNFQPAQLDIDLASVHGPSDLPLFNVSTPQILFAHTTDLAAFANLTWYVDAATRLIGGLRYTHSSVFETASDPINDGTSTFFTGSGTANAATWRVGVQHDFDRHTMVYGTIATGYKGPEVNDALTKDNVAPATYSAMNVIKPERPTSFELGIKTSAFDNRLALNLDVFYTDVSNFQTQSCAPAPGGLSCANVNVGSVKTKGVEWEVFGHPFVGNTINISGIYNVAKYPNGFLGALGGDLGGTQLNYAPKFKLTGSIEQLVPLGSRYSVTFGGDVTIRTSQSMYLDSDPQFVVPGTTIFNARIALKANAGWTLALFGRNLGNEIYPVQLYPTNAFAKGGLWQVLDTNARRQVGFQFEAKF